MAGMESAYRKNNSELFSNVLEWDKIVGRYEVKNESGMEVCTGILQLFFGNLWESTLDRLDHQFDGYLRSLYYKGQEFWVYRQFDEIESVPVPEDPLKRLTALLA